MKATFPENEEKRLACLREYDILDTPAEKAFDDIVRLAARACDVPVALITFVDENRQWFKAHFGFDGTETDRDISFCAHALFHPDLLVVPDTFLDVRFRDNPLVTDAPYVRFYAGAPLVTPSGEILGTVCVCDTSPREFTRAHHDTLQTLSHMVISQMELRRERVRLQQIGGLQEVTDHVPVLIARVNAQRRYVFANRAYLNILGIPHEQVIGHTMADVLGESAYETIRPYVDRTLAGESVDYCANIQYRTIGLRSIRGSYVPERNATGKVTGFVLSATDLTERNEVTAARQQAEEATRRLALIVENSHDAIISSDLNGRLLTWNRGAERLYGYTAEEAVGQYIGFLFPSESVTEASSMLHSLENDQLVREYEAVRVRKDGARRLVEVTLSPVRDAAGQLTGVASIIRDITEQREAQQERERLLAEANDRADRDPLTGLLNHRAFHKKFKEEAERAQRENSSLAIAMVDLNNFKFFNDCYGHLAGDSVLRQVAGALQGCCRSYDSLARFGGDEFAVLMPGVANEEADFVAGRMRASLDRLSYTPEGSDTRIPLSLSVGTAIFPDEGTVRLEVLALADERLYRVKTGGDAGGNAVRLRTEMSSANGGFSMLDALVTAVDNKDRYTRRHSEDVMEYSLEIARELALDEPLKHTIAVAALLHDVGKVGVPDAILRKPGPLTEEQFNAMKQHPTMGAVIVAAVPGFTETLGAIRHHHERWDGQGYPDGLAGAAIPFIARLMAVADAFSAMTTDRPYRKGMPQEKALGIFRQGAGEQWDSECVHALLNSRRRRARTGGDMDLDALPSAR